VIHRPSSSAPEPGSVTNRKSSINKDSKIEIVRSEIEGLQSDIQVVRGRAFTSQEADDRAPIQLTSVLKLNAARMACRWESIKPGMTVRPRTSMTRVAGPASFRMSADVPTALIRPSSMAMAPWIDERLSAVTILPFSRTVSAVWVRGEPQCTGEERTGRSHACPRIVLGL
jgi:hypothetical protein